MQVISLVTPTTHSNKAEEPRLRRRGDVLSGTHVDEGREEIWTKAHVTPPSHLFTLGKLGETMYSDIVQILWFWCRSYPDKCQIFRLLLPYVKVSEDILWYKC